MTSKDDTTTNGGYADLPGLLNIQRQYVDDLAAISTKDVTVSQYLLPLSNKLNSIYNRYKQANVSSSAVLDHQNEMKNIIDKENERLMAKKSSIDSALYGQNRMVEFTDSYRKKYMAELNILIAIVIALLLYLAILFIKRFVPLPNFIYNTITVFIVIVTAVYSYVTLIQINQRYNMNFDKINLRGPTESEMEESRKKGASTVETKKIESDLCIGEKCCIPGETTWDKERNKCNKNDKVNDNDKKDGFAGMMYNTNIVGNTNNNYKPYEPSEYINYQKI